ncbi:MULTISPECIES: serine/threonine-protein kinase [unclassified Coleofasciculus]|uniref:serine/threonine-protein kinase n=1 Tax=unclassified Coleofasciculus TaxID=2692782 RepID=UPI0018822639|nr:MULTISPECIES: serine/threonine-protein kinase [unclassified Coleofasciculus]MBE9127099.1 serine/threonine protein kinase [Coleofasciculus sp. LEGE 07081]MBE9150421.1 serine/threonine protein kinase [Coleofasciculus sp. LEGE 07092]
MSYCLNLSCKKPQNPDNGKFCSTCGTRLLLGDRYRAQKLISQGGIGRTFLAIDERDKSQSPCIIKQFSSENQGTDNTEKAAESFREEAARLQGLGEHPQIPQFLGYFEPDNQTGMVGAIVQRLIEGESLAKQLESEGAFRETEIRQILAELLPVLQFIHAHHVIHRDINPENIIRCTSVPPLLKGGVKGEEMGTQTSQLMLVDFSAAKFTTKTALARTGTVIGSAAYSAPEQLMGKALTSSDLYSLGVTCIHLLTNIHPFDLFNSLEGVWVWQDYLIAPVSSQLSQILNKMLERAVKLRYQSAAEVYQDLDLEGNLPTFVQTNSASQTTASTASIPTWKCLSTLRSHVSSINAIAFSPDGKILASGSADRTVKLWNLIHMTLRCTLSGHSSLVDAVAFSPDGHLLASGSWDYAIKIWNLETEEWIHNLSEHSGWIKAIAISPDGQLLVSGSTDKIIKFWSLETGDVKATLCGNSGAIHTVAVSPDGHTLASGGVDGTIEVWNLESREVQRTLNHHTGAVNSLAFSPSGQLLISGSADGTVKVWNLSSSTLIYTLTGHSDAVNSVAMSDRGNLLISGSADKTIKLWHPGSGKLQYTLSDHSASVTSVVISPDGSIFASGSQDKTVKIWRFE